MNRRFFALALACALALSLLTACGGDTAVSSGSTSRPDASTSQSDASTPEELPSLSLNKADLTLSTTGATSILKAAVTGTEEPVVWTSSDENVAVVAADGTVTAVTPGNATITVTVGSLTAQCMVTCDWEVEEIKPAPQEPSASVGASEDKPSDSKPSTEEKPSDSKPSTEEQPGTAGSDTSADTSTDSSASASVDLLAFYETIMNRIGEEDRPFMMELDSETAEGIYPGIGAVEANQKVMHMPVISAVVFEISMVECANAADVDTVKAIFQTRIDNQVSGGAWYPETIERWKNNSKIVVVDNYVALFVVPEDMIDVAAEFEKLF